MDRARLKEFREVRMGAVKLHWTGADMAEYEAWLGRRAVHPSGVAGNPKMPGLREIVASVAIVLVLIGLLIPIVYRVKKAARHAEELNARSEQSGGTK